MSDGHARLADDMSAALTAAGELPALRHQSGFTLTPDGERTVLVDYRAAGTGEAVMKREALVRWMRILGEAGWTATGLGSRKLSRIRVTTDGTGHE